MAKIRLTLEIEEGVFDGIRDLLSRPEFTTIEVDAETNRPVEKRRYASVEDFIGKAVFRQGIQSYSHLLPAVVTLQQRVDAQKQAIEDLLTPAVSATK